MRYDSVPRSTLIGNSRHEYDPASLHQDHRCLSGAPWPTHIRLGAIDSSANVASSDAGGPAVLRSDLDLCEHHDLPRRAHLRHSVRYQRRYETAAANGWKIWSIRR